MKAKTFDKKLTLKKRTVAHLSKEELNHLKGGGTGYPCATRTCVDTRCFC